MRGSSSAQRFAQPLRLAILGATLAWAALPLTAQETVAPAEPVTEEGTWSPSFAVHGFGSVEAGKTDGNHFMVGTEKAEVEHSSFALNFSAEPFQRLAIRSQVEWNSDDGESEVELDYAFAEWRISDALRLRFGAAQQPFGLYNEIFDVGTLRPFQNLPQGIYGPAGFAAESYRGAGLRGNALTAGGWSLGYDVYAGGLDLPEDDPFEFLEEEDDEEEDEVGDAEDIEAVREVLGGRLSLATPDDRLSFGVSAYRGKNEDNGDRRDSLIGHIQFLSDDLWIRSEAGFQTEGEDTAKTGYVEVAYFLHPKWQVATRYDRQDSEDDDDDGRFPHLLRHRESALGLNYWFNSSLVIKTSVHWVDGNRFARPEDLEELAEQAEGGTLDRKTRLFALAAQFSF
jgi:hypothetical protein